MPVITPEHQHTQNGWYHLAIMVFVRIARMDLNALGINRAVRLKFLHQVFQYFFTYNRKQNVADRSARITQGRREPDALVAPVRFDEGGVETGPAARLLRHRQTKGAETDRPILPPPRHIPTLPTPAVRDRPISAKIGRSLEPLAMAAYG